MLKERTENMLFKAISFGLGLVLCVLVTAPAISQPLGIDGVDSLPKEFADPAFDRYANMFLVYRAWHERDPMMLTDSALEFAEGERILLRPRRGLSADDLFRMAIEAAADKGDEATLKRLEKAVAGRDGSLKQQLALARSLGGKSRVWKPGLRVSVGGMTAIEFALFKQYVEQIDAGVTRRDAQALSAVQTSLASEVRLRKESLAELAQYAASAVENTPKSSAVTEEKLRLLTLLGGQSRSDNEDFSLNDTRRQMLQEKFGEHWQRVLAGNGEHETFGLCHIPTTLHNKSRNNLAVAFAMWPHPPLKARSGGWHLLESGGSITTYADFALVLAINNGRTMVVPIEYKEGHNPSEHEFFGIDAKSFDITLTGDDEESRIADIKRQGFTPVAFSFIQGTEEWMGGVLLKEVDHLYVGGTESSLQAIDRFFSED